MKKSHILILFVSLLLFSLPYLKADDRFEPNNSRYDAVPISNGTYLLDANDEDWFKLSLDPGTLHIEMRPQENTVDLNMILYNESLQIVAAHFSENEEIIDYNVPYSGTYYLKVYPTSNAYCAYTLTVNAQSEYEWKTELSTFGPVRDVSIALYDIDADGFKEIFIATSKRLNSALEETAPAALICLEENGQIKWSRTFPAITGTDPQTGLTYQTSSVSTMPIFTNLDDDQEMEILVGTGADTASEAGSHVVGQPGDLGALYALDNNGEILWVHQSEDKIGGPTNTGEGRPDGIYSTPKVFDVDGDGKREVIYGGWDQNLWILDAQTGHVKVKAPLLDTIWASPYIADIDANGRFEILVNADITANADAQTETGGIFHVLDADGQQNQPGFNTLIGSSHYPELKGKFEEQVLWSSPVAKDLDGDGKLEIVYGTGNFFHDDRGSYVRVWNYDGSMKYLLTTEGRTLATPLIADLDGDGQYEIVENTLEGYTYIWNHDGTLRHVARIQPYGGRAEDPIFASPVAADINGDNRLELIFVKGAQVLILDADGNPLVDTSSREYIVDFYKGSVAIDDIDNDGNFELISAAASEDRSYSYIYAWEIGEEGAALNGRVGKNQLFGTDWKIRNFVKRFYLTILERTPDAGGLNDWTERLKSGIFAGSDVARGFIFSEEFTNKNTSDETYVTILYHAFFNREPDIAGMTDWLSKLSDGTSRYEVLNGFLYSLEFGNLCRDYDIIPVK